MAPPRTQVLAISERAPGRTTVSANARSETAMYWITVTICLFSLKASFFTVAKRIRVSPIRDERSTKKW